MKVVFDYIKKLQNQSKKHQIAAYSGQMAYFFTLSIFPMLIFFFSIVSRLNINFELAEEIFTGILPPQFGSIITEFIQNTIRVEGNVTMSLSGLVTLYSASRAVGALERAINTAYGVDKKRNFLLNKIYGMFYTLLFIVILILSLLVPDMVARVFSWINETLNLNLSQIWVTLFYWIRRLLLPLITGLLIASVYTYLPNRKIQLKDTYKGVLFALIASWGANVAFSNIVVELTDYSILYGSLSAVIAFMIWLYAMGTIIMIGAEINALELGKKNRTQK